MQRDEEFSHPFSVLRPGYFPAYFNFSFLTLHTLAHISFNLCQRVPRKIKIGTRNTATNNAITCGQAVQDNLIFEMILFSF